MASYTGKFFKEREGSTSTSSKTSALYTGKFFSEREGKTQTAAATPKTSTSLTTPLIPTKTAVTPTASTTKTPSLTPAPLGTSTKTDTKTEYEKLLEEYGKEKTLGFVDKFKQGDILGGVLGAVATPLQQAQSLYLNAQLGLQSAAKGLPYQYLANLDAGKADALIGAMNNKKGYLQQAKGASPLLGGIAEFGANILTDPLSYVAGGEVDDILRATRNLKAGGVAQSADDLAKAAMKLTPDQLKHDTFTRADDAMERAARAAEGSKNTDVIYAGGRFSTEPLALPPAKTTPKYVSDAAEQFGVPYTNKVGVRTFKERIPTVSSPVDNTLIITKAEAKKLGMNTSQLRSIGQIDGTDFYVSPTGIASNTLSGQPLALPPASGEQFVAQADDVVRDIITRQDARKARIKPQKLSKTAFDGGEGSTMYAGQGSISNALDPQPLLLPEKTSKASPFRPGTLEPFTETITPNRVGVRTLKSRLPEPSPQVIRRDALRTVTPDEMRAITGNPTSAATSAAMTNLTPAPIRNVAENVGFKPSPITGKVKKAATVADEVDGLKARGFSKNVATDLNMDAGIRQSFTDTPETYEQLANAATLKKADSIMAKGYGAAYDDLMTAISTNNVKPEHIPLARKLANQAAQSGDYDAARKIIASTAEKLTESGQVSQAAKILRKSDPMTVADVSERIIKKVNDDGVKRLGARWKNVKGITDDELKMLSQIDIGNEKAITDALQVVGKRIASEIPATAFEKVDEFRRIAMLANPKTQARNFLGNVPLALERKAADRVSALMQSVLPAEKRTSALVVDKNSKNIAKQLYEQSKDALQGADKWDLKQIVGQNRQIFKMRKFSPTSAVNFFLPDSKKLTKPIMENVREFTYFILEKGDEPFLKSAFQDRAASYIAARGYRTLDDVPQAVVDLAQSEALKATFKDTSMLADTLNKLQRKSKAANVAIGTVLPFKKTPINITKRALDYSPVGIAKGLAKIRTAKEAAGWIDDISKGLTGTGIAALGAALATNGIIVGPADPNKTKAAFDRATGKSAFTVTTPVGSVDYSWMQPFGSQLAIGAAIQQAVKNGATPVEAAQGAVAAFGDTILSTSVYQNVLDLFRGYGSPTESILQNTISDYPQQLIPTALGQIARTVDSTVRMPYDNTNPLNTQLNLAKSKIPGLSQTLPAYVDVWGREIKRLENPLARAANELVNPANINTTKATSVDVEIRRLSSVFGDNNTDIYPDVAPKSFDSNNKTYVLTADQRMQFQKDMGQYAYSKISALIKTPGYKIATDESKANAIKNIVDDSRDLAKSNYLKKNRK